MVHSKPAQDIVRFISSNGYGARLLGTGSNGSLKANHLGRKLALAVVSGVFLGLGLIGGWIGVEEGASVYFFLAAMFTGGFYVYKAAAVSLKSLVFDMNVLMTISSVGAVFIGQWSEAASVVFLFSVGNMLQAYTLEKTRNSINKLMELAPREARVISLSGDEDVVPVERVKIGDTVLVKPGEYIPVDGTVSAGYSWVNQASITGESRAIEKQPGDLVFAGSLNGEGSLHITTDHVSSDSTLAKMIHMVEEAQAQKAPSQQFVDSFSVGDKTSFLRILYIKTKSLPF